MNDEQELKRYLHERIAQMVKEREQADAVTVDDGFGCPDCGERRVDWLPWIDDDTIECQTCGAQYQLVDVTPPPPLEAV